MYVVVAFVLLSSNICFKNTRKSPPVAKDKQAIHVQARLVSIVKIPLIPCVYQANSYESFLMPNKRTCILWLIVCAWQYCAVSFLLFGKQFLRGINVLERKTMWFHVEETPLLSLSVISLLHHHICWMKV